MIYCDLIEAPGDIVKYAIGGRANDITGELIISIQDGSFDLIKAPENSKVYQKHIAAMVYWHLDEFRKGIFRDKISYEIG